MRKIIYEVRLRNHSVRMDQTMEPTIFYEYFLQHRERMLSTIRELVEFESPSSDKTFLDRLANHLKGILESLTPEVEWISDEKYGNVIKAVFASSGRFSRLKSALIVCHYDTVWPVGTLEKRPFRMDREKAYGPGILDMKAGIVLAIYACRAIQDLALAFSRPVVLLLTGDEEIGSPISRRLIEKEARAAEFVLIPEPPLPNGALKTSRKGSGRFVVTIFGRAAHSGVEPEKGVSAVLELAHQILYLHGLNDPEKGTSVNIGVVHGGSKTNVVAARARAEVDVRVWTQEEKRRIEDVLSSLTPVIPGARIKVEGGFTRPPMERNTGTVRLFEKAKEIAATLRLELQEAGTGGGSDGNYTAALGVSTLDGLGPEGKGAHADHEHICIDSLPVRAALLTSLLIQSG